MPMPVSRDRMRLGGHLYTQTNEIRNTIIHYLRAADRTVTELERIPTGGAGSGTFKPVSGQSSAPKAFEGANSAPYTGEPAQMPSGAPGKRGVLDMSFARRGDRSVLEHLARKAPLILQPGRKHHGRGEIFEFDLYSSALTASRRAGTPLFTEKLVAEPWRHLVRRAGVTGQSARPVR